MKIRRSLLTTAMLSGVLAMAGGTARAQVEEQVEEQALVATALPPNCLPGIQTAFNAHSAVYNLLLNTLSLHRAGLAAQLKQVVDQPTYATLLATSRTIASSITHGRLVLALPDGTVVLDTSLPSDPGNHLKSGNSYQHLQTKTVNENHNSRVAIFSAQQWPCGIGIESKFSTTTGQTETYLALRLGAHLNSIGTARLSTH